MKTCKMAEGDHKSKKEKKNRGRRRKGVCKRE
jgi:hypothetical protein